MIGVIINDIQTITFEEAAEVASKRKGRKVRAIPHNSKCRCGEREVQAAKQKCSIILDVLLSIFATQIVLRSRSRGA